ncbi:MAG: hypothetical protein D6785_00810, partial [Planctomycetota bacterium]
AYTPNILWKNKFLFEPTFFQELPAEMEKRNLLFCSYREDQYKLPQRALLIYQNPRYNLYYLPAEKK